MYSNFRLKICLNQKLNYFQNIKYHDWCLILKIISWNMNLAVGIHIQYPSVCHSDNDYNLNTEYSKPIQHIANRKYSFQFNGNT